MTIREQGITIVTSDQALQKRLRKALMLMGLAVNVTTSAEPRTLKCMPDVPTGYEQAPKPSNRPTREMRKDWKRREKRRTITRW